LPTGELLMSRRTEVVANWCLVREAMPQAFDRQAENLVGHRLRGSSHWEVELFTRLREAVELTALQRSVDRWAPVPRETPVL
jgi:hypothetical protein